MAPLRERARRSKFDSTRIIASSNRGLTPCRSAAAAMRSRNGPSGITLVPAAESAVGSGSGYGTSSGRISATMLRGQTISPPVRSVQDDRLTILAVRLHRHRSAATKADDLRRMPATSRKRSTGITERRRREGPGFGEADGRGAGFLTLNGARRTRGTPGRPAHADRGCCWPAGGRARNSYRRQCAVPPCLAHPAVRRSRWCVGCAPASARG